MAAVSNNFIGILLIGAIAPKPLPFGRAACQAAAASQESQDSTDSVVSLLSLLPGADAPWPGGGGACSGAGTARPRGLLRDNTKYGRLLYCRIFSLW